MKNKLIAISANDNELSKITQSKITKKLVDHQCRITYDSTPDADLIICIGGDGALLETVHKCNFPKCPIVGINTGHLGFFQELQPDDIDRFLEDYINDDYTIQKLSTVKCQVTDGSGEVSEHYALNEITIKGWQAYSIHLYITIDGKPIEKFSGDGLVVATSAGSTAYNYSLGGSIADPRLNLLQLTPIAPMNTTAYRSFTSSLLLPSDVTIGVKPEYYPENRLFVLNDGVVNGYTGLKEIKIEASDKVVNLIRFKEYDFWDKVKNKFL